MEPDALRDQIEATAAAPKRVRTDAGEVETRDLSQLIEADKYLAAARAAKSRYGGLRITKLIPPGTI
jgi:hypothetical protein